MRCLLPGLLVLFALAASAPAAAAGPSDVAAADALFQEARVAARKGDHATACPKFRESYRLDPTAGTLLNVADCEEQDGHFVDGLRRFEEALGRLPPTDDRVTYVRSRIRALEERVARVVGTLGLPADRVRVFVDGTEMTSSAPKSSDRRPLLKRLDPGTHEIRVEGPGRDERLALVLKEGETKELDFAHSIAPAAAAAPDPAPAVRAPVDGRSSSSSNATLGLVIGGVGVAGLAASGVTVALMFSAKKTADQHCLGSDCDQAGIDATAAGKRFGIIGGAAFAAGAIGVGLGTFLFFHGRAPGKDARSLSLGPSVTPGGGSIVLGGTL